MKKRRKWWHWLLIALSIPAAIFLVLFALFLVSAMRGGVPLGGVTFTGGDIAGMPVYPGAVQTTDGAGVNVSDDMRRVIGGGGQWKLYLTDDSEEQVLAWYEAAIAEGGFRRSQPRESGEVLFFSGETRHMLSLRQARGKTAIVLAQSR